MLNIINVVHPEGDEILDSVIEPRQPLLPRRVRFALVSLVLISFASALFSVGWEALSMVQARISTGGPETQVRETEQRQQPPVHPVNFFPQQLKDYTVFGRQRVRGEESFAAEAIFKPEIETYTTVEPLTVYTKISYYGSDDGAQQAIDKVMRERNVVDRINVNEIEAPVSAGYSEDNSMFVLAWVSNGYAVEIDTSYTSNVPSERTGSLEKNALIVAKEIWAKMTVGASDGR